MDETNANIARLEELLQETLEVAEENNKILRSMQRTARWSFFGKLLLWIIVLILHSYSLGHFCTLWCPPYHPQLTLGAYWACRLQKNFSSS